MPEKKPYNPLPSVKPQAFQEDFFGREMRTKNLPTGIGVPEFEAAVLLGIISTKPGLQKKEVVAAALDRLGRSASDERIFLKYVDCLIGLGQVARYDFSYHLTPTGSIRFRQIRSGISSAMNLVNSAAL